MSANRMRLPMGAQYLSLTMWFIAASGGPTLLADVLQSKGSPEPHKHTIPTNSYEDPPGLQHVDHTDPTWIMVTTNIQLHDGACESSKYESLTQPCFPDTRFWRLQAPQSLNVVVSLDEPKIADEWQNESLGSVFVDAGVSFRLYQGDGAFPAGPLHVGPMFVATDWSKKTQTSIVFAPNTAFVAGGHRGALANYSIVLNPDCNQNGIPDQCDVDCNAATSGGSCSDVYGCACGLEDDCNNNLVPDSCEFEDLDQDGISDLCLPPHFRVVELGTLGGDMSAATSITLDSASYRIAGYAKTASGLTQAVVWTGNSEDPTLSEWHIQNLGDADDHTDSFAYDVSESGWVVGTAGWDPEWAFLSGRNIEEIDLGYPPAYGSQSYAYAVNTSGQVVGDVVSIIHDNFRWSYLYSPPSSGGEPGHAVWLNWDVPNAIADAEDYMHTVLEYSLTAQGINSSGSVVGTMQAKVGYPDGGGTGMEDYAYIWRQRHMQFISPRVLPYLSNGVLPTRAVAINDAGHIAGTYSFEPTVLAGHHGPMLWLDPDREIYLDKAERKNLCVHGLNDWGDVVGSMATEGLYNRPHAILWHKGRRIDLNELISSNCGWELTTAHDINNDYQIVGEGLHHGKKRAFLLNLDIRSH